MPYYVTLDDRGYTLAQYAREPDNAVAGPYHTPEQARMKMDHFAQVESRPAKALGWVLAIGLSVGFVALGWAMRGVW